MCKKCGKKIMIKKENKKIKNCELCEAKKETVWHYSCNEYWIAECKTCGDLMVVYRYHARPSENLIREMTDKLNMKAEAIYNVKYSRLKMDISDKKHWNCHARLIDNYNNEV